jgi:hypothetical protein
LIAPTLKQKIFYKLFVPKGVSRKPSSPGGVISDLFMIRSDDDWQTYFEILNIPGLLNGSFASNENHSLTFVFFDSDGDEIGRKIVKTSAEPRETINLDKFFFNRIAEAATFSLFHTNFILENDLEGSYLAERGYTGYKRKDQAIKAYVHGNLDAIALVDGKLQMLGNFGVLKRSYQIQHPFVGAANYELFIVNPCDKEVRIEVQSRNSSSRWKKFNSLTLQPRGSEIISLNVEETDVTFVRIVSRLYLGRPIVIRNTINSLDIFHG